MPRGAQPGERRGGRTKGTPNKTPLQKAEALAAKLAKAEARAAVKVAVEPLEHKLAKEVLDWGMQYCVARAAFRRPALADEPPNPNEDGGDFLKWFALAAELAKTLAPYQSPRLLAHAIKAPATENCAAPGTNASVISSAAAEGGWCGPRSNLGADDLLFSRHGVLQCAIRRGDQGTCVKLSPR